MTTIEQVRFNMVEQQIRTWEVLDVTILDLLYQLKREDFVPEAQREFALMDIETPLAPVAPGRRMWTPKMEARVVQDLALKGNEHVLEIGSGSGYLTALLAARSARVTSIEIDPALVRFASDNLQRAGVTNATVTQGDGAQGWPAAAPYDAIVFTGAMEVLPDVIWSQLKPGGRIFAVIGKPPVQQAKIFTLTDSGGRSERVHFETLIAPLDNAARLPAFVF